jgi:4-aminobutyrate aminotransferase-like enzyme/Ser/Thr protein kinase RdoA (MazF antagonist)
MTGSFVGRARPEFAPLDAQNFVKTTFGVAATATELGSQEDRNFLMTTTTGERYLLKICSAVLTAEEMEAQNGAMATVARAGVSTPIPIEASSGSAIVTVEIAGTSHLARLATFVEGRPLVDVPTARGPSFTAWGRLVGTVSKALVEFRVPSVDRALPWDLRNGVRVVDDLAHYLGDDPRRDHLVTTTRKVEAILESLRATLPLQAVHADLSDDNVVCVADRDGSLSVNGVIDFGDLSTGWRVAELAVACAEALHYVPERPLAVVNLVAAFDAEVALLDDEITALWPLIVLRGAVLVVSGEQQVALDPENTYVEAARERQWASFRASAEFDWSVAAEAFRLRLGRPGFSHEGPSLDHTMLPVLESRTPRVVELGFASRALTNGSWLESPLEEESRLLTDVLSTDRVAVTRFGEGRLTRARALEDHEPVNVALALVAVVRDEPVDLVAPFGGEVSVLDRSLVLVGASHVLFLEGVHPTRVGVVVAGDSVAQTSGPFTIWLALNDDHLDVTRVPPRFVRPSEFLAWRRRFEDPRAILDGRAGVGDDGSSARGLARRLASYHALQSHYYAEPPQIERGWREHLIDVDGRHYLDMVNNVTILGHGHPRIADVAADQWRMLNTNSRFHYDAVTELSERLLSTLPPSFDSVLLVNSGTEAVDLALRLTKAFSGREDVMCVTESYHGWSLGSDAVSTSVSDNPRAKETRPSWVHATATPNAYRGIHRGPGAGAAYASDTIAEIRRLSAKGTPIGTFIIEPRAGNAGALEVPVGYLLDVFGEVRAGGGVCISDEVQVGYGRQGDVFWGYQQHPGVVPDVITIAKAMGNGHPLGAVITRREVVDALSSQGSFFSSAGGSTLSCRIGIEVLEIMRQEDLQGNALVVGNYLASGLEELAQKYPLIGAVHGRGLYLGVELVRDRTTLDPAVRESALLCDLMRERGVIVQTTGDRRNILKVKPPLCFSPRSADFFLTVLEGAIESLGGC